MIIAEMGPSLRCTLAQRERRVLIRTVNHTVNRDTELELYPVNALLLSVSCWGIFLPSVRILVREFFNFLFLYRINSLKYRIFIIITIILIVLS